MVNYCAKPMEEEVEKEKKPTRFEIRLKKAMNPRCRKYNRHLPPVVSAPAKRTHLQAVLQDIGSGDIANPNSSPYVFGGAGCVKRMVGCVDSSVKAAVLITGAAVADAVDSAKAAIEAHKAKKLAEVESARHEHILAMRRKYYEKDAERRKVESERIRAATPPPANPMPTREMLVHAYVHRHISEEAAIRFGSLVIDLEEHVRKTVAARSKDGRISGMAGGVREWLKKNCPELASHYHTCQRFKRKAQPDL